MTAETTPRRVAIVTGSSRGLGRAVALALAPDHDIVVHFRRQQERAERVADEVRALGADAIVHRAELEDPHALESIVAAAVERFGAVDVVVANAAAGAFKPLLGSERMHARRTFDTIAISFFDLVRLCAPHLRPHSRIVAVSGSDSRFSVVDHGMIGAAKAAIESMVRNFAVELAPSGITVNAVVPGPMETESMDYGLANGVDLAPIIASIPIGRLAKPEEVAAVVRFLCSEQASFMTGSVVTVDGGLAAGGGPWVSLQRAADDRRKRQASAP